MKAFVQLWCDHAGIVRVGPEAEKYGDPYRYALPFRIENGRATFEGLCFTGPISAAKAAIKAVEAIGLKVRWERRKGGSSSEVGGQLAEKSANRTLPHYPARRNLAKGRKIWLALTRPPKPRAARTRPASPVSQ